MARLRSNEWNFSSNAATRISEILQGALYQNSPLGHAEAELTELLGAKRLDLVLFDRNVPTKPLVTAELKVPWDALGRTPHNAKVLEDAHRKASRCGAEYFITWNIRRAVIWRTDDPGVPLDRRVLYDRELVSTPLTGPADLSKPEFQTTWKRAVEDLVGFLHQTFIGPPQPAYLPLDRIFIGQLESLLDLPVEFTAQALSAKLGSDANFRRRVESWMRDRQGWIVSPAMMSENIQRASRFTCYVLVNRLCFYSALRRKYTKLERLTVHSSIKTGAALKEKLATAFRKAMNFTGDYETVFATEMGDELPFLSNEIVADWRTLIRQLDSYDFATIDLEVIGAMYERLISPEERHRYGQHYTQPPIVDLINAFSIHAGTDVVLDPACGGGTFLVRAYARKRHLDPSQDHTALLAAIYGCDLLHYACHLSVINLAVRDLIDDENFPRVHLGDFLDVTPKSTFAELPIRVVAGGLPTGVRKIQMSESLCNAVVGNPPYIQARQIPAARRTEYLTRVRTEWPGYDWSNNSDILIWFFTHSATFLKTGGYLSLLTQSAWLDVEYGVPLQRWILDHFRIIAVMESEAESWFTDARVATVVTILVREPDAALRASNVVRFVQFQSPLVHAEGGATESTRQRLAEDLRDAILGRASDGEEPRFRLRIIEQAMLAQRGTTVHGRYIGSKWGRFLRTIESLYSFHRDHAGHFCDLESLAKIERGITTNCDDFFIVHDISGAAIKNIERPTLFFETYGVRRAQVANGQVKIVERSDGAVFPLEVDLLTPVIKTARHSDARCTSQVTNAYAVILRGPRKDLSRFAERYIASGEQEHWHESVSFGGRGDWYMLRETETAPILFVKTIQYTPQMLWNDAGLLANQRLYNVTPLEGVDPEVLGAVLESTVFAAERFAGVKALGREAANDVEVSTARQFKVPNVRGFSDTTRTRLRSAFRRLREREVGSLLEPGLVEAGLDEARLYIAQHPAGPDVWSAELRDVDRQTIDAAILEAIGLTSAAAVETRARLYTDLTRFIRRARLLELEAQQNRRGRGSDTVSSAKLADTLWADLLAESRVSIRTLPNDFLPANVATVTIDLPIGRVKVEAPGLFAADGAFKLRFGRDQVLAFESEAQRDLAALLASHRVRGPTRLPRAAKVCKDVTAAVSTYMGELQAALAHGAAEITDDAALQGKIVADALKRVLPHRGRD